MFAFYCSTLVALQSLAFSFLPTIQICGSRSTLLPSHRSLLLSRPLVSKVFPLWSTQLYLLQLGPLLVVTCTAARARYVSASYSCLDIAILKEPSWLVGLALTGNAPRAFMRINRWGVPYVAVITSCMFGLLSYMSVSSGAGRVFGWSVL